MNLQVDASNSNVLQSYNTVYADCCTQEVKPSLVLDAGQHIVTAQAANLVAILALA